MNFLRQYCAFLLCLLLLGFAIAVTAQPKIAGKISGGFQAPTSTDAKGRRHVLKGETAEPRGENLYELTDPRVTSFNAQDEPEMFIESPRCLYDTTRRLAYSGATLSVRTADGRFGIQGVGWNWDSSNAHLVISNQVTAHVSKTALTTNAPAAASAGTNQPVKITSDLFEQLGESASFIGNVLVEDGPNILRCDRLNIAFVKPGGVEAVEAVTNVRLQQEATVVTSGRAHYDLKQNFIRLTEKPQWQSEGRDGSADVLTFDRAQGALIADGSVYMRLPLTNVTTTAADGSTRSATNRFLEVRSNKFRYDEANSNRLALASYDGNVRVVHTDAAISSTNLTVHFDATNRIQQIVAAGKVIVDSQENRAFGERAEYDLKTEKIVLSGDPHWELEDSRGRSEVLIFYPKTKEVHALRNVEMILQSGSAGGLLGLDANKPSTPKKDSSTVPTIIRADTFSRATNVAVFNENVVVADARGRLSCEMVTIVTGASNQVTRIIAERSVVIEQQGFTATGSHADYDVSTGLVLVTGDPQIIGEGRSLRAESFVIDRNRQTFSVSPGKYRIQMKMKSGTEKSSTPFSILK